MVDVHWLSGGVWALGGLCMLGLGYLIAFRGRADLPMDMHGVDPAEVDPEHVARRVGPLAMFMGAVTLAHGIREARVGFDPASLALVLVVLLVCSALTKRFVRGWTPWSDAYRP